MTKRLDQAPHMGWAICLLLAASAPAAGPTPAGEYEVLMGEGLAGSGFVVRHQGVLLGVCSRHQFDGDVPGELVPLDGEPVRLDAAKVVKQKDVQVLPVSSPAADLPFLDYQPEFQLAPGDAVLVLDPAGGTIPGTLDSRGMRGGTYRSSSGPATLSLRTDRPFTAQGASGSPIVLKRTGAVIGVVLTADDPRAARTVGFETLCLDKGPSLATRRPPTSDRLGRAAGVLFGVMVVHAALATPLVVVLVAVFRLARPRPAAATPPGTRVP